MTIAEFQRMIEAVYGEKDRARGVAATFQWLSEEVGELARALRKGSRENLHEEFADVFAWLATLASMSGVELEQAVAAKYPGRCVKCDANPCACAAPLEGGSP